MAGRDWIRFLDFEFDPASGDLHRGNHKLRIPRQTSRLLAILIERPGAVVSRAELQRQLWPDGEFLDHEQAINRVVTDLRGVFRDDARKPRYIETVHKRGYRFLPAIETSTADATRDLEEALDRASSAPEIAEPSPVPFPATSPEERDSQAVPVAAAVDEAPRGFASSVWRWSLVALCFLAVAVGCITFYRSRLPKVAPENGVVTLGIAPFVSQGDDADAIGESLRLDLADGLAQLPSVQVRATNSLSSTNRDPGSIRSLSDKLHLDVLLLGTLRIQGEECTFEFELVRGRDALHLASFQYRGTRAQLSRIRDQLQRDVFLTLQGRGKSLQAVHGSTDDPLAYSEYLRGRELAQVRDPKTVEESLEHYKAAIARDPKFAAAYAGMASAHLELRFTKVADHQNAARQLAQQALTLDPQLAEAHAVLGDVACRGSWDFASGERELRRAIELDPHKAIYHAWLASLMVDEGRFREARDEVDRAISDDPLWPTVYSIATFISGMSRDLDRTIVMAQKYVSLLPHSSYSENQLAWAYFSANRYEEALDVWGRVAAMDEDAARIALEERGREAFRHGGIQAYARVRLQAIEAHSPATLRHVNDFDPAEWYAYTGQRDKAISALQEVVATRDSSANLLAVNPMFDSLHDDPRFLVLLHRVGLTLPDSSENRTASKPRAKLLGHASADRVELAAKLPS